VLLVEGRVNFISSIRELAAQPIVAGKKIQIGSVEVLEEDIINLAQVWLKARDENHQLSLKLERIHRVSDPLFRI